MAAPTVSAGLDPALFRPEAIDPETAAFNARFKEIMAGAPPMWSMQPAAIRARRAEGQGPFGPQVLSEMAVERQIDGPAGKLTLRTFVPDRVDGAYLYFHGGGWVLGGADQQDPRLEELARSTNQAVVSVEYRLAPEQPYPAAPDDCEAAAVWVINNAGQAFGTDRLTIGGESAGAHLAVSTLIRLRDRHGFQGFRAADLMCGVFDLGFTPSAANAPDALLIPTPMMHWFIDHFVPPARRTEPDVSPLRADLHGLPPALFSVGTLDPLLDDSLFMYSRWIAAGNEAGIAVYPGGPHSWLAFPTGLAGQGRQRIYDFLKARLAG